VCVCESDIYIYTHTHIYIYIYIYIHTHTNTHTHLGDVDAGGDEEGVGMPARDRLDVLVVQPPDRVAHVVRHLERERYRMRDERESDERERNGVSSL